MKNTGRKKNFHFGIFEVKKWEKWVCCVWAATPQDCQNIFRKLRNLAKELIADARSVMLRIPLPEDDGFALTLLER